MKRTANLLGGAPATVSPKAGMDSSHGSAIATPAPRRTARREMRSDFFLRFAIFPPLLRRRTYFRFRTPLVPELRALDDGLHQRLEAIPARRQRTLHILYQRLIGKHQGAFQRERHQLPAQIVDEVVRSEERRVGKECRSRGSPYH